MNFPKYNQSNKTGRTGATILTKLIESELGWIVRLNHQEDDFGIDAFIDITSEEGFVTGKSIAAQIKSGDSYFREENEFAWKFIGEMRHLNYYLNHDIPVIVILVDVLSEVAYWEICTPENTSRQGDKWVMSILKNQQINKEAKNRLRQFVPSTVDYVSQLENYGDGNKMLTESGRITLVVGREDVNNMNYEPLKLFMQRVCSNKQLLFHLKEGVEIAIHGYDNDPRELNQIEEVKQWIQKSIFEVPGLSYFLINDENAQFLKLFMFSMVSITYIQDSDHFNNGILRRKVEFDSKELAKVFNILFTDLNDFTTFFSIEQKINDNITGNIAFCLTGEIFEKE